MSTWEPGDIVQITSTRVRDLRGEIAVVAYHFDRAGRRFLVLKPWLPTQDWEHYATHPENVEVLLANRPERTYE